MIWFPDFLEKWKTGYLKLSYVMNCCCFIKLVVVKEDDDNDELLFCLSLSSPESPKNVLKNYNQNQKI